MFADLLTSNRVDLSCAHLLLSKGAGSPEFHLDLKRDQLERDGAELFLCEAEAQSNTHVDASFDLLLNIDQESYLIVILQISDGPYF